MASPFPSSDGCIQQGRLMNIVHAECNKQEDHNIRRYLMDMGCDMDIYPSSWLPCSVQSLSWTMHRLTVLLLHFGRTFRFRIITARRTNTSIALGIASSKFVRRKLSQGCDFDKKNQADGTSRDRFSGLLAIIPVPSQMQRTFWLCRVSAATSRNDNEPDPVNRMFFELIGSGPNFRHQTSSGPRCEVLIELQWTTKP